MFKGALILVLAYVAAVSCAIIPVVNDKNAETQYNFCPGSVGTGNASPDSINIIC